MAQSNPLQSSPQPIVHELPTHHVLIVDDDVPLLESFKEMLQMNGFRVSTATNGVEALKTVMSQDVDAILCDLMMPNMAGDMFYLAVERTKPRLCRRFIFVTGYENDPKFGPFLKRINAVVLNKPVTMDKLLSTVYSALTRTTDAGS
jgi:CheY-like chemotaxis protein